MEKITLIAPEGTLQGLRDAYRFDNRQWLPLQFEKYLNTATIEHIKQKEPTKGIK